MGIKSKIYDKAEATTVQLRYQAQCKFIKWLMKEEDVDETMAWAIVEGRTEEIEWEYTLGFKLADPVLQLALFKQHSKTARRQAAENFAKTLSEEEKEIFFTQVFDETNAAKFKKKMKEEKKKKGIKDED